MIFPADYKQETQEGIVRLCLKCLTPMNPTGFTHACGSLGTFECPSCGYARPWVLDPRMDGSKNQAHQLKEGGFSCASMLSDPTCTVFTKPVVSRRTKRPSQEMLYMAGVDNGDGKGLAMFAGPSPSLDDVLDTPVPENTNNKPVFVTDDKERKTHRWHYGRQEWVKL